MLLVVGTGVFIDGVLLTFGQELVLGWWLVLGMLLRMSWSALVYQASTACC
jgi:hypothetical protein